MWLSRLNIKWWRSFHSGRLLIADSESNLEFFCDMADKATDAGGDLDPSAVGLRPSEAARKRDGPDIPSPLPRANERARLCIFSFSSRVQKN
jgi:hypothetical protein